MADESGGLMSEFDRGTFLLAKQLMYFERYGRLFVSELPILNDREFIEQLCWPAWTCHGPGRMSGLLLAQNWNLF
jgi:hypothetical protein